ncbi:DUF5718 family protein [Rubritalea marina]|uniref:DUF5718 family protein n=1 Tax=Rubritalea marina TaxID=361055 RepID=UPI0003623EC7|nr:DUF5718 family protein [Rubritalea marina]
MAEAIVPIDDFNEAGGTIDRYRLACYLVRDGKLITYGKDTAVSDYCYLNQQLVEWMLNQINTQTDHGPLEPLSSMIASSKPRYAVVGIGATCYSDFGNSEDRFLRTGDEVIVATYDSTQYGAVELEQAIRSGAESKASMIIMRQKLSTLA